MELKKLRHQKTMQLMLLATETVMKSLPVHNELLGIENLVAYWTYICCRLLHHSIPVGGVEALTMRARL